MWKTQDYGQGNFRSSNLQKEKMHLRLATSKTEASAASSSILLPSKSRKKQVVLEAFWSSLCWERADHLMTRSTTGRTKNSGTGSRLQLQTLFQEPPGDWSPFKSLSPLFHFYAMPMGALEHQPSTREESTWPDKGISPGFQFSQSTLLKSEL